MAEYLLNSLNLYKGSKRSQDLNKICQVDSPESPETPEITEKTKNFIKVTNYLTKLKETSIIMFRKNLSSKNTKNKIFRKFQVLERALW